MGVAFAQLVDDSIVWKGFLIARLIDTLLNMPDLHLAASPHEALYNTINKGHSCIRDSFGIDQQ